MSYYPKKAFNPKSTNKKTGKMFVAKTDSSTCWKGCGLFEACYGKFGPISWQWDNLNFENRKHARRSWKVFLKALTTMVGKGQKWRDQEVGDLPTQKTRKVRISKTRIKELSKASSHTRGWTYTHHKVLPRAWETTESESVVHNRECIDYLNSNPGYTVNLSADYPSQADQKLALGIGPVCVTVPSVDSKTTKTPGGATMRQCPYEYSDTQCVDCNWCSDRDRNFVVLFTAHGQGKKRAPVEPTG